MSLRLLQARTALRRSEQDYQRALLAEYPVGSPVRWMRSGEVRSGKVVEIAGHGRVLVRTDGATRPYWIFADDIADASKAQAEAFA